MFAIVARRPDGEDLTLLFLHDHHEADEIAAQLKERGQDVYVEDRTEDDGSDGSPA